MDVVLFTDRKHADKQFTGVKRSRAYTVKVKTIGELKDFLKSVKVQTLLYIDAIGFKLDELRRTLTLLERNEYVRWGIIDHTEHIQDVADLFHRGCADYLPKAVLNAGVPAKRIKAVLAFKPFPDCSTLSEQTDFQAKGWKIAPNGWKDIKSGEEYTFCFLYVELDMMEEWKTKSGKAHMDDIQDIFRRHLERNFGPQGGKIWMWMNRGGVLLFPFDGKMCDSVLTAVRFVLNRTIISIEEYHYNTLITYTMGFHIGNTIYKSRGDTGELVADTLNFLFHFGKQFAEPGHLYCTEPVMPFIRPGLKGLFKKAGPFEGVSMFSTVLPKE